MRSFGLIIVLLVQLLTKQLNAQVEPYSNTAYIAQLESKAHTAKKEGGSAVKNNYDYIYARCNWNVNPAVRYISGHVLCMFKAGTTNFNRIEFDLSAALTVDSVIYFNSPISFERLTNDLLVINLPSTVPAGTIDSVCVYYKGTPSSESSRSFTTSEHAGVPILWTLSEPFGAKDWWPCKQNLSDKIDSLDIIVHVPDGNRVASNGVLLSEKVNGATKTVHWKTRYPTAAYLVAIAVTNYGSYTETVTTPNATVQVLNYVYPEEHSSSPFMGTIVGEMIKLFDSLTIPYPFAAEKYGHAQFNRGGGMEHQTMSFISGFDYSLMAHELAHQWFGDHITCGSWKDIWLNEGFATYFEGLCIERYRPVFWAGWREGKIKNVTQQAGGTIWCDDTTSVSRIFSDRLSYTKGAIFLHMLRWKLGDSLFFLSIKNYLNDPQLRLGFAKTNDLKKHLETTSNQNLDRFFDQWFYKEGYPSYKVNWIQTGNLVSITIDQTQSHPSVSFFEMPVQLKLVGPLKDSLIILNHTASGQTFTIATSFKVTDLNFDPEFWILSDKNTVTNLGALDLKDVYVKVYPNPAKDKITLEGFKPGVKPLLIKITDASGKFCLSLTDFSQFIGQVTVYTSSLQDGAYTLHLETNVGSKSLKFIKK